MLELKQLCISYGDLQTVKDVSFTVNSGQIVGIVGESGSGKSTTIRSILGILPGNGKITSGEILFDHQNLAKYTKKDWTRVRGREIAMIFQHPAESMDPVVRIGDQFYESMRAVQKTDRRTAMARAKELLTELQLEDTERILRSYPFELSGGMCQRVAIAMAMANGSRLLLADEPTSALDVTVQAQTIKVLLGLREKYGTSILLVTHNMGVVAHMADMVGVMYHGELVEWGSRDQVLNYPTHEYTRRLIRAIPKMQQGEDNFGERDTDCK
ncbi:MAG: ABC transporter ATP-binding protein [Eubacteriales bacterium]|nr:ABC transporter ATP-binding protein [Eubacteriales bacterium]